MDLTNFSNYHFWAGDKIIHTTYHRGQLIIALKKLGKEIVGTDYLFYFKELFEQK